MIDSCVFCAIIHGVHEASIVYEDDASLAFMDLRQPNGSHVLVVPKIHVETIYDLTPAVSSCLIATVIHVAQAVRRHFQPPGLNIWQSNGEAAWQEVPHVHFHIFIRQPHDGFLRVYPAPPGVADRASLDTLAAQLRAALRP